MPTSNTNVSITAMIKHISGINNATVYWREVGGSEFNQLSMTIIGDDNWSVALLIPEICFIIAVIDTLVLLVGTSLIG